MLFLAMLAVLALATAAVPMTAPRIGALLTRIGVLAIIAALWMPLTQLGVDALGDPLYRKDHIVGAVLMLWSFMLGGIVGFAVRLITLLLQRMKAVGEVEQG